ncbi:formyl transferase domain-containing protein [Candidatus Symbiothrix dinenymphae]|nr:formyl transferase domain-containing protein [Candidatus Symbiothrix dinenymphae]
MNPCLHIIKARTSRIGLNDAYRNNWGAISRYNETLSVLCSGGLGFRVLEYLILFYKVEMVFTDSNSFNIIELCNENGIDVFIGNPRNNRALNFIRGRRTNVLVSINYLFIVESDIIAIAKELAFNIHGSILPKYRGRTPHVWSIINNETETGITAHLIDTGCDTGDIIEQVKIPIDANDTGNDILVKYCNEYIPLIDRVLANFRANRFCIVKQDHSMATYFGKRSPTDGVINWDWQKERIYNWVRAQASPYPGAFTYFDNQKITIDKISYSTLGFDYSLPNGYVVDVINNIPYIKTSNGVVSLDIIREGEVLLKKNNILTNG